MRHQHSSTIFQKGHSKSFSRLRITTAAALPFKRASLLSRFFFAVLFIITCSGCFLIPFVEETGPDPEEARVQSALERYYSGKSSPLQRQTTPSIQSTENKIHSLVRGLSDKKATKRAEAATYLGMYGERAGTAVPSLEKALQDPERYVRRAAARSLGKIGKPALIALPSLQKATKDRDSFVAHTAQLSVAKLQRIDR